MSYLLYLTKSAYPLKMFWTLHLQSGIFLNLNQVLWVAIV